MIELSSLTTLSDAVRGWLEYVRSGRSEKKAEYKNAIRALSQAILETRSYVKLNKSIADKEKEIQNLWNEAHIELKQIDNALAQRCFAKAEYWTNPKGWDDAKIKKYNITLNSMSESLKALEL